MMRSIILAALAALVLGFGAPAQAQSDNAAGQWAGWVRWGTDDGPINASWSLNDNGTLVTNTAPQEYGYWVEVSQYVEMLYPCTRGTFICHFRGRRFGDTISGTATTNEGHSATFQMER